MRPTKRELRRLFVKEGWSPQELADHYHCSRSTVYRWLHDLDLRWEKDLWDLFVTRRWSLELLARYYGRSRSTVYRWLHDLNIRRERDSWALTVSADELRALYDELTLEQVGDREHVTLNQVYKAMKHHQIPRRRPGSQDPPRPQAKTPPPADELRRVLHDEGSVKGVADHYGVGVSTAHRWLSGAGIAPLRPPGQRRSTAERSADAAFGPGVDGGSDPARTISTSRPVG